MPEVKTPSLKDRVVAHAKRRKTVYVSTTSFIAGCVITRKLDIDTRAAALEFIKEKGLTDEFFTPEI